jgi:phosphoglycerol transferase
VGVAAIVGAALLYRPWGWRGGVPFSTQFDNQLNAIFVRNILDGSVYTTDRLGAPFAQQLQDFPAGGDRWSYVVVKAIGIFEHQPYTVLNIFFLLGFGLVATSAYLVARELGSRALFAALVAWLTAFMPYHFAHDETHVWLANYAGQPLAVLLAVWVLRGQLRIPLLHRRGGPWTVTDRRRLVIATACIVVLGGNNGYYAVFAILVILASGVLGLARQPSWRTAATGIVVASGITFVLLINLSPELAWRANHGVDHAVSQRSLSDNARFGLQVTRMVLPGPAHRIDGLASLGRRADPAPLSGRGGQQVGIVALVGLLLAWWALLKRGIGRADDDLPLPVALGAIAAFLVLLGTVNGIGYLIAVFGMTQFRAWGRVAVQITFCGLLAIGWALGRRFTGVRGATRARAVGVALIVLAVGLADQIPTNVTPDAGATRRSLESSRAFVADLERALPRDAMVFQFPVATFPEAGPTGTLPDYSLALPYILGDGSLRWSYGGIRGRESDWQLWWAQQPLPQMLRGLAAAGFDAVTVDRRAYPGDGAVFARRVGAELGAPRGASPDGQQIWFDLRPLRAEMAREVPESRLDAVGRLITHGVVPTFSGDIGANRAVTDHQSRLVGRKGSIRFTNPLDEPRTVEVRVHFRSPTESRITLSGPDGRQVVHAGPGRSGSATVQLRIPAAGHADVALSVAGPTIAATSAPFAPRVVLDELRIDEPRVRAVTETPD